MLIYDFEQPIYDLEAKINEIKALTGSDEYSTEIIELEKKLEELKTNIYGRLTRWQKVQIARHPDRPYSLDYFTNIFEDFTELHGDRKFHDDKAIIGGFAKFEGKSVMLVGHQKGRGTKENLYRNFGMPNPDGYRKAARLFKLAEKFNKPIITFLDTPGAYPGIEAEERGQAEAIASNLMLMSDLKTPIIVVIIGEGASGGAIGIGVGDRILMFEYSWYSVISPESCSSILWRSWDYKEQAAEALKLTAEDLSQLGIIDRIVPEPLGGAHHNPQKMFETLKNILSGELNKLIKINPEKLAKMRREKFYKMGIWEEK
ncbi:MAG TPA: acetyl-CoA carboxylase carboxyltransferase subunit alpha [Candidatus Kapabacteria bacterium]|jgi:acetyl-CoA carboxylase carboxyl transferase subunit alpha|nr:acetyl-CoA carboxylase carboxyltransferase subunit alpha [Candidatus Kapabacteria bacterium]